MVADWVTLAEARPCRWAVVGVVWAHEYSNRRQAAESLGCAGWSARCASGHEGGTDRGLRSGWPRAGNQGRGDPDVCSAAAGWRSRGCGSDGGGGGSCLEGVAAECARRWPGSLGAVESECEGSLLGWLSGKRRRDQSCLGAEGGEAWAGCWQGERDCRPGDAAAGGSDAPCSRQDAGGGETEAAAMG